MIRPHVLSPRERSIVIRLAQGFTVKEIATEYRLSVKTVETHKFNAMQELDIHKQAHLTLWALQNNLIDIYGNVILPQSANAVESQPVETAEESANIKAQNS
jgi:DNA-binding CsgD family transcriptional regulator